MNLFMATLTRYGVGALSVLYLIFPNLGLAEPLPDAIPVVGHADEVAATFLAAIMFRIFPAIKNPSVARVVVSGILGVIGAIYLVYPSFSLLEFIPDVIPFVGNLDEAGAALLVANALRTVFARRDDSGEQGQIIEGQTAAKKGGAYLNP